MYYLFKRTTITEENISRKPLGKTSLHYAIGQWVGPARCGDSKRWWFWICGRHHMKRNQWQNAIRDETKIVERSGLSIKVHMRSMCVSLKLVCSVLNLAIRHFLLNSSSEKDSELSGNSLDRGKLGKRYCLIYNLGLWPAQTKCSGNTPSKAWNIFASVRWRCNTYIIVSFEY